MSINGLAHGKLTKNQPHAWPINRSPAWICNYLYGWSIRLYWL